MLIQKNTSKLRRKKRVSYHVVGSSKRPRVSVFRSNKNTTAQVIDDAKKITLAAISTIKFEEKGTKTDKARTAGLKLGSILLEKKIKQVVFDRGSSAYKGRVKAFAEGLREAGVVV